MQPIATASVFDACLRLKVDAHVAPGGLQPVLAQAAIAGPARPARHAGSVDVFLEAIEMAAPGDVLVIDNQGRRDEGCIGDLIVIEAKAAGLGGILVWGMHRDHSELQRLGLPVFSYGRRPNGPLAARTRAKDALDSAAFGDSVVTANMMVVADEDGAVFLPAGSWAQVEAEARAIMATERKQADAVRQGRSLRQQLGWQAFVAQRAKDPGFTFREHLRRRGGEIEE
jgi:4-hydroxy-4-methyl-2-oxoglutarate aldolase